MLHEHLLLIWNAIRDNFQYHTYKYFSDHEYDQYINTSIHKYITRSLFIIITYQV